MRIIAGEYRGRRLEAPRGQGTRPTTDRVRESLMSAIHSARGGFDGAVVLDAFAGSGALSLEALSRGAVSAVLCESDREAASVIERNVRALGLTRDEARLARGDVLRRPPMPASGKPFDLVFLDPPYALAAAEVFALLARLSDAGALAVDAIVSYEHDGADDAAVRVLAAGAGWSIASHRRFGDTAIDILERSA
ncbi:16S rRNA (guanine(966)-N(2))-methyltransferase RsmD [Adlercreutzia sp. R21]|uniref:16S rRNA (guanine(966)-N(2))-methyltransferase RsmD n=1 Tax=Adlercreutzia wanghongyangiae TaxID=3111451 RepID=UPI002DB76DA3|nr:16S rRNA (guanine(966)-N(2))-methyltransferase RsmD [Adlercreutzia sp. R21]MEC4183380.1 16S rRNA (guanine(966)-N(2))-methyltransferase RsmD [Adlercreutzia sp. R21]